MIIGIIITVVLNVLFVWYVGAWVSVLMRDKDLAERRLINSRGDAAFWKDSSKSWERAYLKWAEAYTVLSKNYTELEAKHAPKPPAPKPFKPTPAKEVKARRSQFRVVKSSD